jgi:AraC family transcriptional regulator of adaptative response/methylated-DNA-[protein]-cysteine methyltransferase
MNTSDKFDFTLPGDEEVYGLRVRIARMTPDEYGNGGENLPINYDFVGTPFGKIILATTPGGLCRMAFADDEREAFDTLRESFPKATYRKRGDAVQQMALTFFSRDRRESGEITCHLRGTDFRLKVWEALLKIPPGRLTTYGEIAVRINCPGASRAVGSAVGENPVSILIPCHRVIRSSGQLGGYRWGVARKAALIALEAGVRRGERPGSLFPLTSDRYEV